MSTSKLQTENAFPVIELSEIIQAHEQRLHFARETNQSLRSYKEVAMAKGDWPAAVTSWNHITFYAPNT